MKQPVPPVPGLPRDDAGPVFRAPWEAQAFALALALYERGVFTWPEWADALARRIAAAQRAGDADRGDTYYVHWLGALEDLVTARAVATPRELQACRQAWREAADRTPHGQPIELTPPESAQRAPPRR